MEQDIIIIHGIAIIIIRDLLPGVLEFTGVLIEDGDFPLELVMAGSVGVSILSEEVYGALEDTEEDIVVDIVVVEEVVIAEVMRQVKAVRIEMYIIIENLESKIPVTTEQIKMETVKHGLQEKQIICIPTKAEMYTNAIKVEVLTINQISSSLLISKNNKVLNRKSKVLLIGLNNNKT